MLLAVASAALVPAPTLPCVGQATGPAGTVVVVGTVHSPCRSAAEVRRVIAETQPDAVVIELDQERFDLLQDTSGPQRYGAEFAAAASAAVENGVPVVLGDARTRDIKAALLRDWTPDVGRLVRAAKLATQRSSSDAVSRVSVPGTLLADPAKGFPVAVAVSWVSLLFAATTMAAPADAAAAAAPSLPEAAAVTAASAVFGFALVLVAARVLDVLLIARDEVLADSALRAVAMAAAVRDGRLLRRRFTFSTASSGAAKGIEHEVDDDQQLALFTVKRPLGAGEVRRLNLYEPRWLAMMDDLAAQNRRRAVSEGGEGKPEANDDGVEAAPSAWLPGATLGCVLSPNRWYSRAENGGGEQEAAQEEDAAAAAAAVAAGSGVLRSADVLLESRCRVARVLRAEEAVRPVTGARLLRVWVEGLEAAEGGEAALDGDALGASSRGYLVGRVRSTAVAPAAAAEARPVRIVCVVGLAHANGVLDRCAEALAGAETRSV